MTQAPEVSVIMPCLNEAETLATCIRKARLGFERSGIRGEVVIADNGSTDGSQQIALREGARVIEVAAKGYGNALHGGIHASSGKWIIMGDADDSYDFSEMAPFVAKLREGWELVMGCRLPVGGGTIMPGAMPWKHRWIGSPALSFIGRLLFKCPAHDFHCGLRAFTKEGFVRMDLRTSGMELASELVIKATLCELKITEVPITLHPDDLSRAPSAKLEGRVAALALHATLQPEMAVSHSRDRSIRPWHAGVSNPPHRADDFWKGCPRCGNHDGFIHDAFGWFAVGLFCSVHSRLRRHSRTAATKPATAAVSQGFQY